MSIRKCLKSLTLKFTNSNWLKSFPVLAEAEEVIVFTIRGLGGAGVVEASAQLVWERGQRGKGVTWALRPVQGLKHRYPE